MRLLLLLNAIVKNVADSAVQAILSVPCFQKKHFHINGELGEYKYASSKDSEVTKGFCSKCGSPIYGRNTRSPEHITLSLGTMDDANDLAVQVVVFARDKQPWDELNEDAVCFQTQPDWKPDS